MKRVLNCIWDWGLWFRQRKLARALAAQGWQVDAVLYEDTDTPWSWGEVYRVPRPVIRYSIADRIAGRLRLLAGRPVPLYDAFRVPVLKDLLGKEQYDVVQWNYLAEASEAADIAHRTGSAFVLDLQENYPYNYWSAGRDLGEVGLRYDLSRWLQYECEAVSKSDSVNVSVQEMSQRLVGMHYTDPDKIFSVQNTEHEETWADVPKNQDLQDRFGGHTVGLYVGSCSRHRGLDVVIRAMGQVRDQLGDFVFVVVGAGPSVDECKQLAEKLGVADRVSFEGWKDFAASQSYYHVADFGIIPHHKYGQTDNTVPHKLYQNFIMGKPVLVSSCHSLLRIMMESEAGLIFEAGNHHSAARELLSLIQGKQASSFAANALQAMQGDLGWGVMAESVGRSFNYALNGNKS
ncbi:MAG: glycosyltransferase family 4 protein [Pseudodesulfovibrio sp.]|nr:glycosyltransferase family 4 protein [Pseudodesulfovibrio sp.]